MLLFGGLNVTGSRRPSCLLAFALLAGTGLAAQAIAIPTSWLSGNGGPRWRNIGPQRGGRAVGVAGAAAQPDTFYFGSVGGGLWKTENSGRTWTPIFDAEPVQSIGAVAVAPSDPNIVYVGTGEADIRSQNSYGDGMYKSSDAGKTWQHMGLDNTRRIGRIVV
ncbi:MAG: WD40/YVTN/BNR-like repeat-containing protein, partial [Terriglobales bacterium]